MNEWKEKCAWRTRAAGLMVLCALAMAASASGEINVERLDGAKVTRMIVHAGDGSVTRGTVATGSLGPAVIYHADAREWISGCWGHTCAFGFADQLRFANFRPGGGELSSYSFAYAAGYAYLFDYCVPGDPAAGRCDCYCPTGGVCDEGDPPYTVDAALYDGPPGLCGGGMPIAGTEVQFQTSASRPLGDGRIEVRVELEPKAFVPSVVWGVVTLDIEDAWMAAGALPTIGSSYFDGAMRIDGDSDGCWDEWECWDWPCWYCPYGFDWATFHAEANAEIVFSLVPAPPPPDSEWADLYTYTIDGGEAVLAKAGEPVWLEIRVGDFDPNQIGVMIKAWQAGLDSSGYASGLQGTLTPLVVDCTADPGICATEVGPGSACPVAPTVCPAGFIDRDRTDFIFYGQMILGSVDTSAPDYLWASTLMTAPIPSPGQESYLGSLVLFVPADAKGTFTIPFLLPPYTALIDSNNQFIPLIGFVPAKITVEVGACCFGLGAADDKAGCVDGVSANQCENVGICKGYCQDDPAIRCGSNLECEPEGSTGPCIGGETLGQVCSPLSKPLGKEIECDTPAGETCVIQGVSVFSPGSVCTGDPCSDCGTCLDDLDCDDGHPCTRDTCDVEITCTCRHTPDYDLDTECCDPDTGALEPLDDGDPCTLLGICDPATGEAARPPAPAGIACGEGDTCVLGYYCDGAGSCVMDPAPVESACDDGDECTTGDHCDGAGNCVVDPIAGRPCVNKRACEPGSCVDGVCRCPAEFVPVPTVSGWGAVIVALVLIVLGKIYFGRRRRTG